ncbi:MAG: YqjF family protein [Terriglobales bacterium]
MNRTGWSGHPNCVTADEVFLTAEWRHLALLNYEVDASLLLPFVPAGTELDRWHEKVFISLVGFRFLKTKLFGFLPIPLHSNFEEVNLRFYVRRQVGSEVRRGVVFVREIVPRRAVAFVARTFYKENYVALPMAHEIRSVGDNNLSVTYRWRNGKSWSEMSLETDGESALAGEGSVEQFITEHYWGYAAQPGGGCVEYRVTHPSWRVWQVRQSAFEGDAETCYGMDIAAVLRGKPESAFLAQGSPVAVMRGRKL